MYLDSDSVRLTTREFNETCHKCYFIVSVGIADNIFKVRGQRSEVKVMARPINVELLVDLFHILRSCVHKARDTRPRKSAVWEAINVSK